MYLMKIILAICCLAFVYAKPTPTQVNVNSNKSDPHALPHFPDEVCRTMDPGSSHGPLSSEPQTILAPYSVTTSKTTVKSGEELEVTIKGNSDDEKILGFFIQGRPAGSDIADGTFIVPDDNIYGQTTTCFKRLNNAVIFKRQRGELPKSVTFTWKAPNVTQDTEYTFVVTVYKEMKKYWTNLVSNKVTVNPL